LVTIHPQKIEGHFRAGVALDLHTTGSTPIGYNEAGHMQFDTARPEIAELLYQFKYQGNQTAANGIIEAAGAYLQEHRALFDLMIPVPPSTARAVQPVLVLARGIGAAVGLPVVECIATTRATAQLKGVTDPDERAKMVDGLYAVDPAHTANKRILLFDDLFRSGTTMNAITDVLLKQGNAKSVCALTITKTRRNR
jgi:competence protein ComFC